MRTDEATAGGAMPAGNGRGHRRLNLEFCYGLDVWRALLPIFARWWARRQREDPAVPTYITIQVEDGVAPEAVAGQIMTAMQGYLPGAEAGGGGMGGPF